MEGLSTALLVRACRTFLAFAYADGNVPPPKRRFRDARPDDPLESLLVPPICQQLPPQDGPSRGYALRLGCAWYPNVKLQVADCGIGRCVFGVDTHDAISLEPSHPDAEGVAQLQADNRCLKEQIERAWEAQGLKTFNALLRDGLAATATRPETG